VEWNQRTLARSLTQRIESSRPRRWRSGLHKPRGASGSKRSAVARHNMSMRRLAELLFSSRVDGAASERKGRSVYG
jgi:hypothetical protein